MIFFTSDYIFVVPETSSCSFVAPETANNKLVAPERGHHMYVAPENTDMFISPEKAPEKAHDVFVVASFVVVESAWVLAAIVVVRVVDTFPVEMETEIHDNFANVNAEH